MQSASEHCSLFSPFIHNSFIHFSFFLSFFGFLPHSLSVCLPNVYCFSLSPVCLGNCELFLNRNSMHTSSSFVRLLVYLDFLGPQLSVVALLSIVRSCSFVHTEFLVGTLLKIQLNPLSTIPYALTTAASRALLHGQRVGQSVRLLLSFSHSAALKTLAIFQNTTNESKRE